MRLACPSLTTRGSSSNTVGVLRRGSFFGCSLFGFFLLIPLQSTPSAFQTQVPSHLPSALRGTAVHPLDESQRLSRSGFCNPFGPKQASSIFMMTNKNEPERAPDR